MHSGNHLRGPWCHPSGCVYYIYLLIYQNVLSYYSLKTNLSDCIYIVLIDIFLLIAFLENIDKVKLEFFVRITVNPVLSGHSQKYQYGVSRPIVA